MKNLIRKEILALALLIILCWFDYQYFTEGKSVLEMSAITRRIAHLLFLAVLIPVGYWGLGNFPKWMRGLWFASYAAVFCFLFIVGVLQVKLKLFSVATLDQISTIRLFFGSPMPFMILYILFVITRNSQAKSQG
ncbi:MAG TPA: hypothetical protein VL098_13380 [Flavipsychrobacter sp.]|nr:hypothetical protein [Flavipsychrobacter sp.]